MYLIISFSIIYERRISHPHRMFLEYRFNRNCKIQTTRGDKQYRKFHPLYIIYRSL
jgi:hypothetical protein